MIAKTPPPTTSFLNQLPLFLALVLIPINSFGESPAVIAKAGELYSKLTGTPLMEENSLRAEIMSNVAAGNMSAAAKLITDPYSGSKYFYDSVVKMFALTFNKEHSTTNTANDLTAFIIGSVLKNKTLDDMLTGNYYFMDPNAPNGQGYSETSDAHYDFLDQRSSFHDRLVETTRGSGDIGIFTTRSFASDFYRAGTSRRPWKGIVELLYCIPQTDIKTLFIPDDKVRRDVPRVQNGTNDQYRTNCKGCHAQMDAAANPFGLFDFPKDILVRQNSFTNKINEPLNYLPGFNPTSDAWWLYYPESQQAILGLKDVPAYGDSPAVSFAQIDDGLKLAQGKGLKSFARVIAASTGVARCMATRIVTQMYLRKAWSLPGITAEDREALNEQKDVIEKLTNKLVERRNLREIFEDAAIQYLH